MVASLSAVDVVTVVASFVAVFGIAIWGSAKKVSGASGAADFFLAGRNMPWWIIGGSLFASNIGTEHFVGQAGTAAASGIAVGLYEWTSGYMILALGWIFAPVYLRCQLTTIPELLEKRFNKRCRLFFVVISLLAYIMAKISATLFAGVVLLETVVGWNAWQSLPAILCLTAMYTIVGGLTTVMLTDTVQMFIFVIGGVVGSILALNLVGGINGLFSIFNSAGLADFNHLLRPVKDSHFPWPGMLFGIPVVSIWYWCVDQEMAQRVLSAPNITEARLGTGFAALLKAIPVFITVFPGMVARALYELCLKGDERFSSWCDTNLGDQHAADRAYPLLVLKEFPQGVKGVMVASFLAAMMSSLASVLNSASTVFTYDVYRHIRGIDHHSSKELVLVGRLATAGMTILAFCWLPVISLQASGLYICTQTAMTHLAPPVSALYICGLFVKRANGKGAFIGVLAGSVLGLCRLAVFLTQSEKCKDFVVNGNITLTPSNWFVCINFNYFALLLFGFTFFMIVVFSLLFPPPSHGQTDEAMVQWAWPLRKKVLAEDSEKEALLNGESDVYPENRDEAISSEHKDDQQRSVERVKSRIAGGLAIAVLAVITSLIIYFH